MKLIGSSNGRQVFHVNARISGKWEESLPMTNWLALPILDKPDQAHADRIARACLDKDVAYVCTLGRSCEMLHDCIDETIAADKVKAGFPVSSADDFDHSPMTTWHNDFEEGVWFAILVAHDDHKEIHAVVCIDMTDEDRADRLASLVTAINDGWLPPDRD